MPIGPADHNLTPPTAMLWYFLQKKVQPHIDFPVNLVDVRDVALEQVTKQLNKLVNVIKIVELEQTASVQREHMLIKVRADNQTRSNVIEVVNLFRASVVDYATDALVVEVTGDRGKIDAILRALEPFGIKELVKSGMVAVGRGPRSITDRAVRPVERSA